MDKQKRFFGIGIAIMLAALFTSGYAHAALFPPSQRSGVLSFAGSGCGLLPGGIADQISSGSPWYCPINQAIYTTWSGYLPLAMAAISVSFAIAALIFMAAALTGSSRLRAYSIGEFYEAIATALIVIAFMYLCAVVFGLVPEYVVGNINPYATAFNLILSTIQGAQGLYNSLYQPYLLDSMYASISVTLRIPMAGIKTNLFVPVYGVVVDLFFMQPAEALTAFITDGMVALYAQYYLLVFFAVAAIPVFLIPGVILRAFFPTRALGGMLMAIGIGFYLVVPTLFAVAYYFTAPAALRDLYGVTSLINQYGANGNAINNAISATSPLVLEMNASNAAMGSFWLLILFFPLLIMAVTYAFIMQLSSFIGGASRTSGRLRMFI